MRQRNRGFSAGAVLTMVLFGLAAAGVAWVYNGMIAQERWPIRWLEVDGPFERVSAEQVRARLAPLVTGSFFTVNTRAIREMAGDMPWVANVSVLKTWPDTVQVTIHEHTPVVHWVDNYLLDAFGQPVTVPSKLCTRMPIPEAIPMAAMRPAMASRCPSC